MIGTLQPRWAHSATAFCLPDGVTEVTTFGGSADPLTGSDEKQSKLASTTLLQFCKYMKSVFIGDSTCMCNATVFRELDMLIIIIVIMNQVMFLLFCHAV